MSKKQVLILWIIAGTLTAALAMVRSNLEKSPEAVTKYERGDKLAADLKPDAVAKVVISDHAHTTTLVKGEKAWTITERNGYPANFATLTRAISELNEVEIAQALEAGPSYDPRFGMDDSATEAADHGTRVQFLDSADEELYAVTLGKQTAGTAPTNPMMMQAPSGGRYTRTSADPGSVYVIGSQLSAFSANPTAWLAEEFIQIDKPRTITLRSPGDASKELWTVTRDSPEAEFTLEGLAADEEMISAGASGLKSVFNRARFEDVVEADAVSAEGDQAKAQQAVINTFDGFTYTLNLTPKKAAEQVEGDDFNPSAENYFLTVSVTAQLPEARPKGEDETEEEAKAADEAFAAQQKSLKEKLAREQKFQGRAFEIAKWGTNALLKTRDELAKKKEPVPAETPAPSAVSPPVQIPLAPPRP